MACSVLALAVAAGMAAGQEEPRSKAPDNVYHARYRPWPTDKSTDKSTTLPQRPATAPLAPPPLPKSFTSDAHTLTAVPTRPASAALATPIAAQNQPPKKDVKPPASAPVDPRLDFDLPKGEKLFRFETEAVMIERENADRRKASQTTKGVVKNPLPPFPPQEALTKAAYTPRAFSQSSIETEPSYVCYGRLFFEEKNSERYGWDLGPIQPLVSAGWFIGGTTMFPYKVFSFPRLRYDSGAGQCLPGDSVPYYLYPPGVSLTGLGAEAGAILALSFMVP